MTSTYTPAERLRQAADKIRQHAEDATPGPWHADDPNARWGDDIDHRLVGGGKTLGTLNSEHGGPLNAAWIALMHPGVGEALAAWLDLEADVIAARQAQPEGAEWAVDIGGDHALALADQILGEAL